MTTTLQRPRLAERMSRLGTESAFEVLVRARELEALGKEIVHLEIGEPDFATAPHIVEAATTALREGWTHYGPPAGLPQLREAIAEDAGSRRGIKVDPAEVVVTPGAKPIMFFVILALIERDDEVLYPNPGFPIYDSMVRFVGARPVPYALPEQNDFDIDVSQLLSKITDRTRLIILNSPHNPTGGVMSRSQVQALAEALIGGVLSRAAELEALLLPCVAGRSFGQLSPVERAVLYIGALELVAHPETPFKVVVNEAIELGKSFRGAERHRFVNVVLEKLAAELRQAEVSRARQTA